MMIEARGLKKHYKMGSATVRALDGVDLDIAQGENVSITGASGSGKSTLMHILGCLDRPSAGVYRFSGRTISGLGDRQLAQVRNRHIGFVFQTFNLINRTSAVDNVAVPLIYSRASATRKAALEALEKVGLAERASHNPNELSGGERQRVAIARAIVNNPEVILADEPTGNLDTRNGEQILDIFRRLNEAGTTLIVVTHEAEVALRARRIIRMRDGRITSDEVLSDHRRRELLTELPRGDESSDGPAAGGLVDEMLKAK
jgi:putative ABC transport system ATP-binding protein